MISKKKGIKRQRFIVVSCISLLSLVLTAPATASLSTTVTNIAPWLAAIGININPYIKDIKNLESFYAQNVNANIDDVIAGLRWNLGEMGLPIAGQIPNQIQNVVAQVSADVGTYTLDSQKLKTVLMAEANNKYADAQAKILLGEEGQRGIQDSLENNAKIVESSSASVQAIRGMTVSQQILQEQSQIDANNSFLLGSIYEELVLSRINSTWNNQHNAVLANDIQRKNWNEEVTKVSQQAFTMRSTAEAFSYQYGSVKAKLY